MSGFNLIDARLNSGFTTKALAREIGVHENVMRRLEGKVNGPVTPENAKKVADHFGVLVTDLVDEHCRSLLLPEAARS
ncbi:MAG: helix-turn-helix transcriptional regulator [Patulibacter minatonensis]